MKENRFYIELDKFWSWCGLDYASYLLKVAPGKNVRTYNEWEDGYPFWEDLMTTAKKYLLTINRSKKVFNKDDRIFEVISIDWQVEELISYAFENLDKDSLESLCEEALKSEDLNCRVQVAHCLRDYMPAFSRRLINEIINDPSEHPAVKEPALYAKNDLNQ
jgi:hypothetical protein